MGNVCFYHPVSGAMMVLQAAREVTIGEAISYIEERLDMAIFLTSGDMSFGEDSFTSLSKLLNTLTSTIWYAKMTLQRPQLKTSLFNLKKKRCFGFKHCPTSETDESFVIFVLILLIRLEIRTSGMSLTKLQDKLDTLTACWGISPMVRGPGGLSFKWADRSIGSMVYWQKLMSSLIGMNRQCPSLEGSIAAIELYLNNMSMKSYESRCRLL